MTIDEDFYSNLDGALTPEQAAQVMDQDPQGDTAVAEKLEAENGGAPETTTATDDAGQDDQGKTTEAKAEGEEPEGDAAAKPEAKGEGEEPDPDKAVVLARDGVHTIPYERLVEAREGERRWREQAQAAQEQLKSLQEQAQARADAGQEPTKTDNMVAQAEKAMEAGVPADLFGDFSEEALAAGIQKLVELQVTQQVQTHIQSALAPLQAKEHEREADAHYAVILGKHPDADSVVQSREFAQWVGQMPSAFAAATWKLFEVGSAEEIVEVFDAFKGRDGQKTSGDAASAKEAAKKAVENAKAEAPASLSEIPGGHAAGASALDNTADMTGPEMLAATANMSPEQIEAWLNRQI